MSAKQLLRIVALLAAVIFLWGLVEIVGRGGDVLEEMPFLIPVTPETTDSVVIRSPTDTIQLVRAENGAWTVNGFDASATVTTEFFQSLDASTGAELVARSASSHQRMGVDSVGGTHVVFSGEGRRLLHLIVGESGRPFRSRYVRLAGDNDVYLLRGDVVSAFDRSVTDWREKNIATVDPSSVSEIRVERASRSYAVIRGDSAWTFEDGTPADSLITRRIAESFNPLTAQGTAFATPAQVDSADFARPDRRLTLRNGLGDTLVSLLFDSTDTGYWVRHARGGTVFQLYRWKGDEITPADSLLRGN